jgi:hypothetical protein
MVDHSRPRLKLECFERAMNELMALKTAISFTQKQAYSTPVIYFTHNAPVSSKPLGPETCGPPSSRFKHFKTASLFLKPNSNPSFPI